MRKKDKNKHTAFMEEVYPSSLGKRKMFSMTDFGEALPAPEPKNNRMEPFEKVAVELGKENAELLRKTETQNEEILGLKADIERLKQEFAFKKEMLTEANEKLKQNLTGANNRLKDLYGIIGKAGKTKHVVQNLKRRHTQVVRWRTNTLQLRRAAKKKKCPSCALTLTPTP